LHGLTRVIANRRLDAVLGTRPGGIPNTFEAVDGLAASPNGDLYTDTNPFGGPWTNTSALVQITPTGRLRALWTSRRSRHP
jgi:hypothetical protein